MFDVQIIWITATSFSHFIRKFLKGETRLFFRFIDITRVLVIARWLKVEIVEVFIIRNSISCVTSLFGTFCTKLISSVWKCVIVLLKPFTLRIEFLFIVVQQSTQVRTVVFVGLSTLLHYIAVFINKRHYPVVFSVCLNGFAVSDHLWNSFLSIACKVLCITNGFFH